MSAYDPLLMCAFFLCKEVRSLCVYLLNLNIAVLSTVFHLLTLNKTDCCALLYGGEVDISSRILQAFKQSLGSYEGSRQSCINQCCCLILEPSVP